MMTLVDLMEVYRIKTGKTNNVDLLLDIYEAADLDERLDRELLADLTLMECGGQFPRWNTTSVFFKFATSYIKSKDREYSGILDLYDAQSDYEPFDSFVSHETSHTDDDVDETTMRDVVKSGSRTPNLTETRTPNLTETRTPNLTTTENGDNYTATHSVSADNETGFTPRTQDQNNQTTPKTSAETGTDTTTNTGTESITNTGSESTSSREDNDSTVNRDRNIDTAKDKNGRDIPAQDLFFKELETLGVDIYQKIVNDFADNLMLGVC